MAKADALFRALKLRAEVLLDRAFSGGRDVDVAAIVQAALDELGLSVQLEDARAQLAERLTPVVQEWLRRRLEKRATAGATPDAPRDENED